MTADGQDTLYSKTREQLKLNKGLFDMPNFEELLTLGELIDELQKIIDADGGDKMVITTGGTYVSGFSSYRGYYEELAIVPTGGYSSDSLNVTGLLAKAKVVDGSRLVGWKGGEYLMTRENALWLAHAGECPGIGVEKIEDRQYCVVLHGKITSDC